MTRFSEKTEGSKRVSNYEGEPAYLMDPKLDLYSRVTTSVLHPQFYTPSVADQLEELRRLVVTVDSEFTMKLAIYAREQMYLRTIPLVLLVELYKAGEFVPAKVVSRVIKRADELYEVLGYFQQANNREGAKKLNKLPNQLKKGIAEAFNKFDAYQLGKYNKAVVPSLRDAMFLSHPNPTGGLQANAFEKLAADELPIPYTWETELSEKGNTKEVWEQLIDSGKLPYMATLRNLRNILQADVTENHIVKAAMAIANKEAVLKSKQLPFRYVSAYRMLKDVPSVHTAKVLRGLEIALTHSVDNLGLDLNERMLIAFDVSASMEQAISPKAKIQRFDIGLVLGFMLNYASPNTITGMFGETWKAIQLSKNEILKNVENFHDREGEVGYSTNGYKVLQWATENQYNFDRIMIFTDCQMWDSDGFHFDPFSNRRGSMMTEWVDYRSKVNPDAKLYLFNLAGYGHTPLDTSQPNVTLISGWSDKIFQIMKAVEEGSSTVKEIERIVL